jgi:hypothetical protein
MSNPKGDYSFTGLGFMGLSLVEEGSQYTGSLSAPGISISISGATYNDATGVVTFSAGESPAGVTDLNFIGNIILDLSGNVISLAGTWTGRSRLTISARPAAPAASAQAAPAIHGIGPFSTLQAHGWWAAFNQSLNF